MRPPEDPFAPIGHRFAEPWHAETLAAAYALIRAGHITAEDWAQALGQALRLAEQASAPDAEETYYLAALEALEAITPISRSELDSRKSDWEDAYRNTPHGQPVTLCGG